MLSSLKPEQRQVFYWDRSLPAFGVRVNPGGTKTFHVYTGKPRVLHSLGRYPATSLANARKAAHSVIDNSAAGSISFAIARQRFIDQHLSKLKPTTAHEQTNLLNRFPFDRQLSAITLEDLNRFLAQFSPGGARPLFNVFRTFINWSVANNYLDRSPLKKSPYKPRFRERLLTDTEIKAIWKQSLSEGNFGTVVRCLILSGQRSAQFSQFDQAWLRADRIVFPPAVMKSNQEHVIPLSPALAANIPSAPFNNHSTAMKRFRSVLKIEHFTLHDFRRYFSSTMASLQVPIDVTEAILDHRTGSRSQIQRIYDRHDRLPQMRDAFERYHAHLLTSIEP